ncbi:uncharacterized protein BDV14DRAFT_201683 [Aspergillus stella-maris]|uniref:uncharacterized protein n=1 Tax=Aspergillus stella-maris TaxID=1810926 RepID=UPI003CCD545F
MIHSKYSSLFVLVAPILSALAQDLSAGIVGCTDVDCPNDGWDACTVADDTYGGIGLARIVDAPESLDGISLVKGVHIEDSQSGGSGDNGAEEGRTFNSVYFLGTPSNLDINDLFGCAVIFNDPPTSHFEHPKVNGTVDTDDRAATGTCPDVIQQGCIDALTEQARNVRYSDSNACSALQSDLRNNAPDECSDLTGSGDGLGSFEVVSLGNISTISQSANASSNCWPVLPKSDNLARLTNATSMGNYTDEGNLAEMYKITPILTVFTSSNDSNSLVNSTTASLTCLKVVTDQGVTNVDNSTTDTDIDAAPLSTYNMAGVSIAALATAMFVLF